MRPNKILISTIILVLLKTAASAQAPCDTITGTICKSIVADTVFNPFVTGVMGNWRGNKSYTYYSRRKEQDPDSATNIRKNGTFGDFTAFWAFQDDKLTAAPDTSRWVWNSEINMFNRKGFEIENRDPLGRYNAGLYGYSLTMPIATIQNSRYRESVYEGFEDYVFATQLCDTACPSVRHIDFSAYRSSIDTVQKHTGKSSLRIGAGTQIGLSFVVKAAWQDTITPKLAFTLKNISCYGQVLKDVKASDKVLLPVFSPMPGKRMLVSAWVKENTTDLVSTYTGSRLSVVFGSNTFNFSPTGSIIEGWQRYESVFTIPDTSNMITISLQSIGSNTIWFDDLRMHPFNANMKSFVFHPVNLRLMAELDENNYATLYEYDDEGTLIRLKKETQRGIKTIKETRSALVKEQ